VTFHVDTIRTGSRHSHYFPWRGVLSTIVFLIAVISGLGGSPPRNVTPSYALQSSDKSDQFYYANVRHTGQLPCFAMDERVVGARRITPDQAWVIIY
jgi:hypothetical protein